MSLPEEDFLSIQQRRRNQRLTAVIQELSVLITEALRIEAEYERLDAIVTAPIRSSDLTRAPFGFVTGDRVRILNPVLRAPYPSTGVVHKITEKRIHVQLDHDNRIIVRHHTNVVRLSNV